MALVILKIKPKVTKAILWSGSKTTLKIEPKLWMEIGKLKELRLCGSFLGLKTILTQYL